MGTRAQAMGGAGGERAYSLPMVITASSVGTMIEWYDFYIFGSLAAVLSPKFYPPGNNTFAYFAYLATFAVGFLVRPFGAIFFGRIGDLIGRKYAFLVTLSVMGLSTALIDIRRTVKAKSATKAEPRIVFWMCPTSLVAWSRSIDTIWRHPERMWSSIKGEVKKNTPATAGMFSCFAAPWNEQDVF